MTYTAKQEEQLRSACLTLADGYTSELFNMYKVLLAEEDIILKEPTEADRVDGMVSKSITFSSEMVRGMDEKEFIYAVGQEMAASLIRTVKYADLCKANGITLNTPKKEEK